MGVWGEFMEVLAKRLKWLRNQNRYTQKEIADKIGMSASGLQKIELGERDPKLDVLLKFCDIYNVSSDFLLGRNNETSELQDVLLELYDSISQQSYHKSMLSQLMAERMDLKEQIYKFEETTRMNEFEQLHDKKRIIDSLDYRKSQLLYIESSIKENEEKLREQNKKLSENLFIYLNTLLELPESNPSSDHFIKKFAPYNFEIQPDIFGEYSIHLSGKGIGFIGHYGLFESVEKATEKIEELKIILNGTQHENILR